MFDAFYNGVQLVSESLAYPTFEGVSHRFTLGHASAPNPYGGSRGDYSEVIMFDQELTDEQVFQVEAYLSDKYDISSDAVMFHKGDRALYEDDYAISFNRDNDIVFDTDGSTKRQSTLVDSSYLPLNEWNHVALSWSEGVMTAYVNGVARGSTVVDENLNTTNRHLTIGGLTGGRFFEGLIDEVSIFNRGLSALEIRRIYNAGQDAVCPQIDYDVGPGYSVSCPLGFDVEENVGTGVVSVVDASTSDSIVVLPSGTTGTINVQVTETPQGASLVIVEDADLLEGETKTVSIEKLLGLPGVCIKDEAGAVSISEGCNRSGEVYIECPGTEGAYTCTDTGTRFEVSGLTHTAVSESDPPQSVGGRKFHIDNAVDNIYFTINQGQKETDSREVVLSFEVEKADEMIISNLTDFKGAEWQEYIKELPWTLEPENGPQTVYAFFKNDVSTSPMVAATILLTDQEESKWSFYLMLIAAMLGLGGLVWSKRTEKK
ncbi:LamG domain-containing protein [Patescibacteria group bacterium]